MRQVPQYLIIGNGRVARHFQHYFSLLKLTFLLWNRQESTTKLRDNLKRSSHVLLLISDKAIENFITQHLPSSKAILIHFSGSLITEKAYGSHPLMTFKDDLYTLETYQSIPFILDHNAPAFEILFPQLTNQHYRLHQSLKEKYHALCVLSGNFSCLLWQKLFFSFEDEFNLPPNIIHAYLLQQTHNLISNYRNALTGPLVRHDFSTIDKNLNALALDPYQQVYQSFVSCYQQLKKEGQYE